MRHVYLMFVVLPIVIQGVPSPTSKIRKGFRDEESSVPDVRDGADDYEYEEYDDEYEDEYDYGGLETFGDLDKPSDNCTDYSETGYKCIPYYNCENGTVITDGGGIIGIRTDESDRVILDPANSICPGLLEVCCRSDDFFNQPVTKNNEKPRSNDYDGKETDGETDTIEEDEEYGNDEYDEYYSENDKSNPMVDYQCGRRNEKGAGVFLRRFEFRAPRTVSASVTFGKQDTQFGEWPHMCAVLKRIELGATENALVYVCGSSLIAPHIVLTAAHCVYKVKHAEDLFIKCGEWDTQKENEPKDQQTRQVKQISIHPAFRRRGVHNDLAILHLNASFNLDDHINPVCLPASKRDDSYDKENCIATGWGKDKFGDEGLYQNILKQVQLNLVDSKDCEKQLQTTRLGGGFKLKDSFICAGGEEFGDTCTGDGGGPLVCPRKNDTSTYVQVGIVSWGIGCYSTIPGVYADVAKATCFIDWASKCVDGTERDYFGTSSGCTEDWAKLTYCDYKARIEFLLDELKKLTVPVEKGRREREIHQLRTLLRPFELAITNCKNHGTQSFDCSDSRGR